MHADMILLFFDGFKIKCQTLSESVYESHSAAVCHRSVWPRQLQRPHWLRLNHEFLCWIIYALLVIWQSSFVCVCVCVFARSHRKLCQFTAAILCQKCILGCS